MCIKNSYFVINSGSAAHIGLRQICDLTILKGSKFGSLSYLTEIALFYATFSYTNRYPQARFRILKMNILNNILIARKKCLYLHVQRYDYGYKINIKTK